MKFKKKVILIILFFSLFIIFYFIIEAMNRNRIYNLKKTFFNEISDNLYNCIDISNKNKRSVNDSLQLIEYCLHNVSSF